MAGKASKVVGTMNGAIFSAQLPVIPNFSPGKRKRTPRANRLGVEQNWLLLNPRDW
jgi:hypothetical protein